MSAIERVVTDVKTAAGVATATTGTGLAAWLEKIPPDIGKLATLVGIVLSCVLIFTHIKRYVIDKRLKDLQIAKLEAELEKEREGR